MKTKQSTLINCSAKVRPSYCLIEYTKCCILCEKKVECLEKRQELIDSPLKTNDLMYMIPCEENHLEDTGICEFVF